MSAVDQTVAELGLTLPEIITGHVAGESVAVDPHAAAAGAAFFDEEVDKVEALLKSGTKIELEEAKNDIEAVLAAGARVSDRHQVTVPEGVLWLEANDGASISDQLRDAGLL